MRKGREESERKHEGVVHLLGSRRIRMRVCTHSGAFERFSRDMHARRDADVCEHACVRECAHSEELVWHPAVERWYRRERG